MTDSEKDMADKKAREEREKMEAEAKGKQEEKTTSQLD